ncbi:OadG family protein [Fervidobacterium islandicum]|uniref:OadG family protein n=1 Tax=Fervidobacterium islandicum TaxID=2423 RepID=A0AAI8CMP8_FERIS|nr:OadG family protein [Fervidobacterium islandicum]AMW33191.1 OadG family protein [Fervidobacterium islandicum]
MPIEATVTQLSQTLQATQLINEAASLVQTTAQTATQTTLLPIELTVTIVGITTVFLAFVILYAIFKLMEYFGVSKNKQMKIPSVKAPGETREEQSVQTTQNISEKSIQPTSQTKVDESEEIAAVFGAIYAVLGTNVVVRSVTKVPPSATRTTRIKGQRGWEEWRTYGWRGGNRW